VLEWPERRGAVMARKRRESTQARRTGKTDRRGRKPTRWAWLSSGFVVALIGLLAAIIPHYINGSPRPVLDLDSVSVQSYAETHPNISPSSSPSSGPITLDFKVSNTGNQLAVITVAQITVQQFMNLPLHQPASTGSTGSPASAGSSASGGSGIQFLPVYYSRCFTLSVYAPLVV
jgi:hypothetical protein